MCGSADEESETVENGGWRKLKTEGRSQVEKKQSQGLLKTCLDGKKGRRRKKVRKYRKFRT